VRPSWRALATPCLGGAVLAISWIVLGPLVFGLERSLGFGVVLGLVWALSWLVARAVHLHYRPPGGNHQEGPST
jgi:hypothetical protein